MVKVFFALRKSRLGWHLIQQPTNWLLFWAFFLAENKRRLVSLKFRLNRFHQKPDLRRLDFRIVYTTSSLSQRDRQCRCRCRCRCRCCHNVYCELRAHWRIMSREYQELQQIGSCRFENHSNVQDLSISTHAIQKETLILLISTGYSIDSFTSFRVLWAHQIELQLYTQ